MVDEEGYMQNSDDWSEDFALVSAKKEGIDLHTCHWEVLYFLRSYYNEYDIVPMIRILIRALKSKLGEEKSNSKYLYKLFPAGPAKQASKFAGLPKPTGCV